MSMRSSESEEQPQMNPIVIYPESFLTFELHRGSSGVTPQASKCLMTLRHNGGTDDCLAFKVKTTQPRRYLVRPNQGLIKPNGSEEISILLVEKDKQSLLQSYDRLGPSALEHSKDKFLVQSCTVSQDFSSGLISAGMKELGDALTSMWANVAAARDTTSALLNKKLHVKHVVVVDGVLASPAVPSVQAIQQVQPDLKTATVTTTELSSNTDPRDLYEELTTLRRKYDELVAFSVNLTAERDILNNSLEQTKRDMNREMAIRASLEVATSNKKSSQTKIGGWSTIQILVLAFACFFMGAKLGSTSDVDLLSLFPVLED